MLNRIKEIVNKWDPLNLFPFAPEDEYMDEINLIYIDACETDEAIVLGTKIRDILFEHFGYEINITVQDCINVAKDIMKTKNKGK